MTNLNKVKDMTIFKDHNYNTFPNVIKLHDGTIFTAFRQAPDWQKFGMVTHIDPASKAVYITSKDDGNTWDENVNILYDDFIYGVQDPCVNLLKDGTIFTTFFMWKAFEKNDVELLDTDRIINDKWIGRQDRVYSIRSNDSGKTWDEPIAIECLDNIQVAVRGNIVELEDETILLPVYGAGGIDKQSEAILLKTKDRGITWEKVTTIASMEGYDLVEPNIFKTKSDKLVAFIRSHQIGGRSVYESDNFKSSPLITCESYDNGETWSEPIKRNIYSPSPFHILQLSSGNVLVSYGYRYKPFGIRAFVLDSECTDFDNTKEYVLREDGLGTDIGYTSAVQLNNGDILITYYYYEDKDSLRYIAGTICREE